MRNAGTFGTRELRQLVGLIRQRLPSGWRVELSGSEGGRPLLVVEAPDGRRGELQARWRQRVVPRDVAHLVSGDVGPTDVLLAAPFLSPRTREMLADKGVSFADSTGNLRVSLRDPAVYLEARGEDRDPGRTPRALKSLKGAAAGRVVRALCDFRPPYGVRRLAGIAATPLGTVSRVVTFLEEEALLTRDERKEIVAVDWGGLVERWARDYNVRTTNAMRPCLEPRGLSAVVRKLERLARCAVTGSLAGSSVAPPRLAMVYVDDLDEAERSLELTSVDVGANVWLLEPYDEVVFERTRALAVELGGVVSAVVAVAPSQALVDLLTSPGRGPEEARAMLESLKGIEDDWRVDPRA